ncbi:MAG: diguanylate cyclase [Bacillus subtilis]|nr:diguanylate cyclase [Bacillus subtilis]
MEEPVAIEQCRRRTRNIILSVGHDITDLKRLKQRPLSKESARRFDRAVQSNGSIPRTREDRLKNIDSCVAVLSRFRITSPTSTITSAIEVGDLIIQDVATELMWFRRKGGLVARISGDEFVIVAHDLQSIQESILNIYRFPRDNPHGLRALRSP